MNLDHVYSKFVSYIQLFSILKLLSTLILQDSDADKSDRELVVDVSNDVSMRICYY